MISSRPRPLCPSLPTVGYGNKLTDGGHLTVKLDEYESVARDPIAFGYLRPFIGSRELLHDTDRWCLWLVDADPRDLARSAVLRDRIADVRRARQESKKAATQRKAATPHLFDEIRPLTVPFLGIPEVSSELRTYVPVRRLQPDVIVSNKVYVAPDPDNFVFGIISSAMFMAWMKAIGGRLKSDVSFSNTYTYNNFPLPTVNAKARQAVIGAADQVVAARANYGGHSLADLYAAGAMPSELLDAHRALDAVVDGLLAARASMAKRVGSEPSFVPMPR